MPVQGKPTNPPPYWQMPQKFHQAERPMTKQEYCAICELKQIVDKIGVNLCSPNCSTCNRDGKGCIRPSTAMPSMQYTPCVPSGDAPVMIPQHPQPPQHPIPPPPPRQQEMFPAYHPQPPIQTYQWPQYTTGMYWPPFQQPNNLFMHNREHPYLPVQIDLPTEETRRPKLGRSKSANMAAKIAELRASIMVGCECTKKNGLQDTCPRLVCKDMPRMGTWENPSKMPCKEAPCKRESMFEEEEEAPVKMKVKVTEDVVKGDAKEVPVKEVQKDKPKPCKPECRGPCNKERK